MAFQVFVLLSTVLLEGASAASMIVTNNCTDTMWPVISGYPKIPDLYTAFELRSKASKTLALPDLWSGRLWARTQCTTDDSGAFLCATGDCRTGKFFCGALPTPPVTFVELALGTDNFHKEDKYQVSVAVGFNVPVSVKPVARPWCHVAGCMVDITAICPTPLRVSGKGGEAKEVTIGCMSACQALHTDQDCCLGRDKGAGNCKPTKFGLMFKSLCPKAVGYLYDRAFRRCKGGSNYLVTFCPRK